MRLKPKTVMDQMNAKKPDDVLTEIEAKHGSSPSAGSPFPFECNNCGHKPAPEKVVELHGGCEKCCDTVLVYTVDAAECIVRLLEDRAVLVKAIKGVLASATPSAKEHRAMFAAWAAAQSALANSD